MELRRLSQVASLFPVSVFAKTPVEERLLRDMMNGL